MVIVYARAGVLILNETVPPTLTLMSVANPWMVESPAVGPMSHWLGGVPGLVFSQAIGLITGGPQGPAASTRSEPPAVASRLPSTAAAARTAPRTRAPLPPSPISRRVAP